MFHMKHCVKQSVKQFQRNGLFKRKPGILTGFGSVKPKIEKYPDLLDKMFHMKHCVKQSVKQFQRNGLFKRKPGF